MAILSRCFGGIIHKFDKYGQLKKQTYIGAPGGVLPSAMVVLSDSSVVLVGTATNTLPTVVSFTNPATSYTNSTGSSFIFKFANTNMNTIAWSTKYPGVLSDVDVNGSDEIYVVGRAFKTGGDAAYLLSKTNALNLGYANISNTQANVISRFDKTGIPNWSSFAPSYGSQGIKVDRKRNNFYLFGQLSDTADFKHFNHYGTFYQPIKKSNKDAYIQKFNSNDSIKVSTLYGGNADDGLTDIEILSDGTACMVGVTGSSDYNSISYNPNNGSYFHVSGSLPNYTKGWINKFDTVMTRKWAITYGDSIKNTALNSVTKDDNDNIYTGGSGYGMQTVSYSSAYYQSSVAQANAIFLMFDANNQRTWATYHGSTSWYQSGARGLAFNNSTHNLCYGGGAGSGQSGYPFRNFTTPVQAYWQPLNFALGFTDAFVGRFNFTGIVGIKENQIAKPKDGSSLFIYPNPSNDKVNIQFEKQLTKPYTIMIYNSIGQLIFTENVKEVNNNLHTLDVSGLKTGIYFINLNSVELNKTAKLIKD